MTNNPPGDVTIGEVWRGMADIRSELAEISVEVKALPAALAKELDDRSVQRVETLKSETVQRVESLKTETNLRMETLKTENALWQAQQETRVARLERIVWGSAAFICIAVAGAVLKLVLQHQ